MEVLSQSKPSLTTKEETSNLALCIIKVDYDYHRLQSYLLSSETEVPNRAN